MKTFSLKYGVAFGRGDDAEMQFDVELQELTAGDLIDAEQASEVLKVLPDGTPVLLSSQVLMGAELMRRAVKKVGKISGMSLRELRSLHRDDLELLKQHYSILQNTALAKELATEGR